MTEVESDAKLDANETSEAEDVKETVNSLEENKDNNQDVSVENTETSETQIKIEEVEVNEVAKETEEEQKAAEDQAYLSGWSFSNWSENFESVEDERPVEELEGDPQKLILWASEKNELETLRKLLDEDAGLVNTRDDDMYTPLHRASSSNNVEVIKILLSYDADINAKTSDGWEPLHCACKWDSIEAVSLLLQNGADVNSETKGHITPLHLAASNVSGRRTLELLLWQPYIDPTIKNDAGDTAYDIARRSGPLGTLFEILEESINVY